jgi:hypothetical protein
VTYPPEGSGGSGTVPRMTTPARRDPVRRDPGRQGRRPARAEGGRASGGAAPGKGPKGARGAGSARGAAPGKGPKGARGAGSARGAAPGKGPRGARSGDEARPSDRSRGRAATFGGGGSARGSARPEAQGRGGKDPTRRSRGTAREREVARERRDAPRAAKAGWGGLATRGARRAAGDVDTRGGPERRTSRGVPGGPAAIVPSAPPEPPAAWVRVDELRDEASGAVRRGATRRSSRRPAAPADVASGDEVRADLERAVGPSRTRRAEQRLREAGRAFDAERFADAARVLKPLAAQTPGVPAVRELYGLTLYRLGRWRSAIAELEAFAQLTGSTEQHPVLADCYRAMRRWGEVDRLWEELRAASPSAALITEGRIVAAGAIADRGDLPAAVRLLGDGFRFPRRPQVHHLRRAYALADLEERVGDLPRARELFGRIAAVDPDFADVGRRLRALA